MAKQTETIKGNFMRHQFKDKSYISSRRRGELSSGLAIALASLVVLGLLTWLLVQTPSQSTSPSNANEDEATPNNNASETVEKKQLLLYCAAGMKPVVAEAVKNFRKETGIEISVQYGGSGTLLGNLQVAKKGDLYLAADISYIEIARSKGLLAEAIPLASIRPVIAVKKGNPKNINSIADLLRNDVTFALANPTAASVGKITKKILEKSGDWEQVAKAVKVKKPTVNETAGDVIIGAVDAAILWDATVAQNSKHLDLVRLPIFEVAPQNVTIGVLKWADNSAEALQFARYLQAPDKGQKLFGKAGCQTVPGDRWTERPRLLVYSGGVNRLAIQDTIRQFQLREGVEIDVVYNGCGILVSMINGSEHKQPDVYFACDTSFMTQVQPKFQSARVLSETDMVLIVRQGNPKEIKTINDLTKEKILLGVANPKQSALGRLTQRLFETIKIGNSDLYKVVQPNIATRTPTADLLVNQLLVGGLDAAIVYRANVAKVKDKLEIISIKQGDPTASQPIAVSKSTPYPYLSQRLVDALTSAESQQRFLLQGFNWKVE